jgi:pyruvate formate lyase activating enzyme
MRTPHSPAAPATGRIFDIKRFAVHDGPGIRTTVFLKGCPLRCVWCHNPEGISPEPELVRYAQRCLGCGACVSACPHTAHEIVEGRAPVYHRDRCTRCGACVRSCLADALALLGREVTAAEVMAEVRKDASFYAHSGGGVTLSGGEPLMQSRFARDLLRECKQEGFHTALDTCGHVGWRALRAVLPYVDLVLYDLKHFDSDAHRHYTGATNQRVLRNLRRLAERAVPVEIRLPLLPTINDSPEAADAVAALLAPLGNITAVRLLAYHRLAGSKYARLGRENTLPNVPAPSGSDLTRVADRIGRHGLRVIVPAPGEDAQGSAGSRARRRRRPHVPGAGQ